MPKNKITIAAVLLIFGSLGLSRYSDGVRSVNVLGLFSSGIIVGLAIAGLVTEFRNRKTSSAQ